MNVALYTPSYPPDIGGNATSTHRLVTGLRSRGIDVTVHRAGSGIPRSEHPNAAWDGQIVHVFHAYRSGAPLLPALRAIRPPLVVSMAGTDINHDLSNPGHGQVVRDVCELADALIVMHEGQREIVRRTMPHFVGKVHVISPGVPRPIIDDTVVDRARALRTEWGVREDEILFLLPAGMREVKRPLFAIAPLEQLRREGLAVRLVVMGSVLDHTVAGTFDRAALGKPWVTRLPPVIPAEMTACYAAADIVLNTSLSEGLSNVVIEAMAAGRALLASDIQGNRACITDGSNGLLFADEAAFAAAARRLAGDPALRRTLGERARTDALEAFDPTKEVERHIEVYDMIQSESANWRRRLRNRAGRRGDVSMSTQQVRLTELASCGG